MGDLMKLNLTTAVGAAGIAAAFLLGGPVLGNTATALAEKGDPGINQEWDLEKYDACMNNNRIITPGDLAYWNGWCCGYSGGQLKGGKCVAPPAAASTTTRSPAPARNVPISG